MITTTLNKIRAYHPCEYGWRKLLKHLGKTQADDEPLPLLIILDSNGLNDTLLCLQSVPEHDREWRLYAVWCARQVQHLMTDPRSFAALDVAERFANGQATNEELTDAWVSAGSAAVDATRVSAVAAARATARDSAGIAAWDSAWYAPRSAQEAKLRRIIS